VQNRLPNAGSNPQGEFSQRYTLGRLAAGWVDYSAGRGSGRMRVEPREGHQKREGIEGAADAARGVARLPGIPLFLAA
jgi:hypothetical protein